MQLRKVQFMRSTATTSTALFRKNKFMLYEMFQRNMYTIFWNMKTLVFLFHIPKLWQYFKAIRQVISSNINILFPKNVLLLIPAAPSFLKPSFLKQCLCVTLILVFAVEELGKKCLEYLGHLSIIRDEMVNYTGANVQTKNQDSSSGSKFKANTHQHKNRIFWSKKFEPKITALPSSNFS